MKQFIIRNSKGRPIAGVFMPLKNREQAERVLAQWQYNYPQETFHIESN
jgi:hypothetical protein